MEKLYLNPYLKLVSGDENIVIPPCNGGKKAGIFHARNIFDYIDPDFRKGSNQIQPTTDETSVVVYDICKNADLENLFLSLSSNPKSLILNSEEQIPKFVQENKKWLQAEGHTFLAYKDEGEYTFSVAMVSFFSSQPIVYKYDSSARNIWQASNKPRLVIPVQKT